MFVFVYVFFVFLFFFLFCVQERRAKEKAIETAKKNVQTATAERRKPDPEAVKLAEQTIEKDETEEGQASQDCEVTLKL